MNILGLVAALTAFFSIWFGHVAVRKIEFVSPTLSLPTTVFAALGLFTEILSLFIVNRPWSVVFGILGITLLFDAFEFTRQQRRIKKGHAPANSANPRHAKLLAEYTTATTLDLLEREPTGRPVSANEAIKLVTGY
jgi:hypothetical protein